MNQIIAWDDSRQARQQQYLLSSCPNITAIKIDGSPTLISTTNFGSTIQRIPFFFMSFLEQNVGTHVLRSVIWYLKVLGKYVRKRGQDVLFPSQDQE